MSTLLRHAQEFVAVTPTTKGYSKATVKVYGHWIRNFAAWVGPDAALDDFCEGNVRAYRNARLTEKNYTRTTLCNMYAAFHAFAAYLKSEGHLEHDPADVLGQVKPSKPRRDNLISDAEAFAMLDACNRYTNPYREALARAILSTFIHGGLRRSELLNLQRGDVYLAAGHVRVRHGKGDKQRDAYLCQEALDALTAYLDARPKSCRLEHLFVLNSTQPVALGTLVTIIKETWAMAGLNKKRRVTCHSLRHNWFSGLLMVGGNLSTVSQLGGHAHVSQTISTYYHPDAAHFRATAELSTLRREALKTPTPLTAEPARLPDLRLIDDESA